HLRTAPDQGGRGARLARIGGAHPRRGSRIAPVAACVDVPARTSPDSASLAAVRRRGRRRARDGRRREGRRSRRRRRIGPRTPAGTAGGRKTADDRARIPGGPSHLAGRSVQPGAMIGPARVAAYEILSAVSAGNADLPTAIAFARGGLRDDRDRALAADIASGVQRWRAALDHLIVAFSKRPLSRLDAEIVEILRLSIYQLRHLTRVPASAVVDDAVNLVRRAGKASATGFVNAVLREVSRK